MMLRHVAVSVVAAVVLASAAMAEDSDIPDVAKPDRDFCSSFVNEAAELRHSHQKKQLEGIRSDIEAKLKTLEEKTAALKTLIEQREAARAKVSDSLLKIYSGVEPEAAAQQLVKLEANAAAELLLRLNPKRSGEILSLMEPERAAKLVALMSLRAKDAGEKKS